MSEIEKIVRFPNLSAIEAEAAAWAARLDAGDLSADDRALFQEWQHTSTHHREAIERLSALWAELDVLKDVAAPVPAPYPAVPAPAADTRSCIRQFVPAVRARWPLAAAAVIAAFMIAGVGIYGFVGTGQFEETQSYETEVGVQKMVHLADGSNILLNTDSIVNVRLSKGRRDVRLVRGEAYFDVAPDRNRPFSVFAAGNMVRAIGTAFAVRLSDQNVEVTVTKGNVELDSLQGPVGALSIPSEISKRELGFAKAGQDAVLHDAVQSLSSVATAELDRKLAWRHGVLAFAGEPLSQAVAEINRYTDVKIEIDDQRLKDRRVAGYFQIGQVDAMLEALQENFGVRVVRVNDRLVRLFAPA